MNITWRHLLPAVVIVTSTAWLLLQPGPGKAVGSTPEKPEIRKDDSGIPAGKGSTTDSGKFVPPSPADAKPTNREQAEQQLRSAMNVEEEGAGKFRIGNVKFDSKARTVSVPAKVNMRGGVIIYALTTEAGKAHEAMLTTTASPQDLHLACLLLDIKGGPLTGEPDKAMPVAPQQSITVSVRWETNGPPVVRPLTALLQLAKGSPENPGGPMPDGPWHYTGSRFTAAGHFAAEAEGSFISLIRDDSALVNYPGPSRDHDEIHLPNTSSLPRTGTPVTVIFQLPAKL